MALTYPAWLVKLLGKLPSLLVEVGGGALLAGAVTFVVLVAAAQPSLAVLALATVGNLLYEWKLDPSGWSLKDVAQRELGIALVAVIVRVVVGA